MAGIKIVIPASLGLPLGAGGNPSIAKDMELSIVIVNYKTKNLTKECVKCIKRARLNLEHEIIVVDNGSRDGTAGEFKDILPDVKVLRVPKNLGFAAGNNLGIQTAKGKNILILNPDIVIKSGEIEKMVFYLNSHPEIGILAPKLLNPDGTLQYSCFHFPKFFTPFYRRTFLGNLPFGEAELKEYLMSDWDHKEIREVDWCLGACLLVKKEDFLSMGFFDEDFFLYFEDADLCRRFHEAKKKVVYFPEASVIHFHRRESAGTGLISFIFKKTTREHIKSWIRYFRKWGFAPHPRKI